MPESERAEVVWKIAPISSANAFPSLLLTFWSLYKSILFATTARRGFPVDFDFVSWYQYFFNSSKLYAVVIS